MPVRSVLRLSDGDVSHSRPGSGPLDEPISLVRTALTGLAASSAVVFGAILGGSSFVSHLPGAWFFGTPGGPLGSMAPAGGRPPLLAVLGVYGGMVLLTATWISLIRTLSRHRGLPVRRVLGVIALWALPFVVAPPLFSRDVYSYAGQGEMVSHHIDPYTYGPGVLGATLFNTLASPVWSSTPSPYGPTFLWLDGAAADLSGHQVLPDLALLRLMELGGLAMLAAGLTVLAREVGKDPAEVVLLGAGSPLVLTTFVGGAHNDALMVGLLLAGLAAAHRIGSVPGIMLCALAAGVKAPAALGALFIGWNWPGPTATARSRVLHTLGAGAISVATLETLSEISGIGWGWVRTLGAPAKISTDVTPVDAIAHLISGVVHLMGLGISVHGVRDVSDGVGLLAALSCGTWLLLRSPKTGLVRGLGLTLLVLAILGPILWAWYLTWGLVVLAVVATGRLRRWVIVLSVAGAFIGVAAVSGMTKVVLDAGVLDDLLLMLSLAAATLVPTLRIGWRRSACSPSFASGLARAQPGGAFWWPKTFF